MWRITEWELILPALYLINESREWLTTTDLISWLRKLLNPDNEEDLSILNGRGDDKFSQKVRNLNSHKTLEKKWFVKYESNIYKINKEWKKYLKDNEKILKLVIQEELFLNKISSTISTYYDEFKKSLDRIKKLVEIEKFTHDDLKTHFFNMLYSSIITSLETYLSDAIKYNISNDKKRIYLRKFVETFKDYEDKKIALKDLFNEYDGIENKVEDNLVSLLYHNLPLIKNIYNSTFCIDFLDIGSLMKSISIRHDLVHRNWKKKDGEIHEISKKSILELHKQTLDFIDNIEKQFKKLNKE